MPRKVYTIKNLGCANCAAKIEEKIGRLPQVEEAVLTFATRKLAVTAQDPDALLEKIQGIIASVEQDARLVTEEDHHELRDECGCGHHHEACCDHDHDHHHHHSHREDPLRVLILGVVLFAAGLVLSRVALLPGLAAYAAAYLLLGHPILKTAFKNMVKGHVFDENFLMSIATLGAFAIGEFPEAVGVMLFFRVGEFFEEKAVERSRSQIMAAVDLRPETVSRLEGDRVQVISARQARVGDVLLVRPGDRIPLDARVVSGSSQLDTAPITGEPVPVSVGAGDRVISGCVNGAGQLHIRVEKPLSESMVTRILEAVERAAAGKPKIDRFITRFARIYTPVVVGIAAATALIPSVVTGDWNYWVYTALSFLVMSCPCALVLSVPLAFFCGIGKGSKQGILFKGGLSMEAMAQLKVVAMDKTGTLTKGEFRLQSLDGPAQLLALCASCEQNSAHPIAKSIVEAALEQGLSLEQPTEMEEIPGKGIRAILNGHTIACGNRELMEGVELPQIEPCMGIRVWVSVDGAYYGSLLISDSLKPGARETVQALQRQGLLTVMLTGDSQENGDFVARELGIDKVFAKLLPQQKLEVVQKLRQNTGRTMFVGDGINDAPVLAGSDVGAAMGSGADAAIEAADVVFLTGDVAAVGKALAIASRTRTIAWQNVVFALAVKAVVMVLGLGGFASMWLAVFADSGVAMLCVLNAVRILYSKKL